MPEGVEVKVITQQLAVQAIGKTLQEINLLGGRFLRIPPENFAKFQKVLPSKITEINCKGKFIWFTFDNRWYLFNTLGMTGSWGDVREKHSAISLTFDDGSIIYFTDPRHFGTLKFSLSLQDKLDSLGEDLLQSALTEQDLTRIFRKRIQAKTETLAEILMNQKIFSGVGNYIKAEALYLAKLSPWRRGNTLSTTECDILLSSINKIMLESYRLDGTTIATYKNFEGKLGQYSSKLLVYGKNLDPLGNLIKSETTLDKRTTWWVPRLQR